MLTPAFLAMVLAASPPPAGASKPGVAAIRSSQPSPDRVEGFKITIAKRRKRRVELRRFAEMTERALGQPAREMERRDGTSAGWPTTPIANRNSLDPPFPVLMQQVGTTTPYGGPFLPFGSVSSPGGRITCLSGGT
jgi:hypothetical protein